MKKYLLGLFLLLTLCANADQKELDAYWAEVSRTVKEGDFQAYKATCHPGAVLVSGSKKESYPLSKALKRWKKEFDDTKAGTRKSSASFRFEKRFNDATTAFESGILLYEFSTDDGKSGTEYVFLDALLVKQGGKWLIMMEYQKGAATKQDWEKLK
ncbi:MAG: hypothetical protein AB8F34_15300 [Akkermansiaceae bacterium]